MRARHDTQIYSERVYALITLSCVVITLIVLVSSRPIGAILVRDVLHRLPFSVPGQPACPGCNVVLISLDTVRADALPCYGYTRNTMPHLCEYAKKNMLFSHFYSQSSYTLDSHMSIFTGVYPSTHHVVEPLVDELNPAIPTLPQLLKKAGYRTIYAGVTDDYALPLTKGFERGFDEIHEVSTWDDNAWPKGYESFYPKLLDKTPTFLFLHTYMAHSPYLIGEEPVLYSTTSYPDIPLTKEAYYIESKEFYQFVVDQFTLRLKASETNASETRNTLIVEKFQKALQQNDLVSAKNTYHSLTQDEIEGYIEQWYWNRVDQKDPAVMTYIRGLYDQRLKKLDTAMISLLSFLERPDVKRNTIVVITSDHGEEFMEHHSVMHNNNIYNTSTHVPYIMASPHTRMGVYDSLAQSIDIFPTILSLIGASSYSPIEGESFMPLIVNTMQNSLSSVAISQHHGDWITSVQDGVWKLYVYGQGNGEDDELYNLHNDKDEQHNVANVHPDIVQRLQKSLKNQLKKSPQYPLYRRSFPEWMDERLRSKLIEDGYF